MKTGWKKGIAAATAFALLISGCGSTGQSAGESTAATPAETEEITETPELVSEEETVQTDDVTEADEEANVGEFPEYIYSGKPDDPNYQYMFPLTEKVLEQASDYDPADVSIPVCYLYEVDDSDPTLVKVWGYFGIYNFDLDDTTLVMDSGGFMNSYMELVQGESEYKVQTSKDANTDDEWVEILSETGKADADYTINEDALSELTTNTIQNYLIINASELPLITGYTTGGDVIELQ